MSFFPSLTFGFWNAWILMSVFIFQMMVMAFLDKGAWERSHVPAEAKKNKLDKITGGVANTVWLLALGYSLFLPLQKGSSWFYTGLGVFLAGLIILIAATINFIASQKNQVVSNGVYRFSRHPMYLATFLICLGSGFASGSGLFVVLSIVMALCFDREARIEERHCLKSFGSGYKDYLDRTPRFFGFPKKINE